MLLTSRQLLQAKALDIENDLRGTLRNFGLKVGLVGTVKFEARIHELVADYPDLAAIVKPVLMAPSMSASVGYSIKPRSASAVEPMTAWGRVSLGSPVQTAMRNCTRDEGRSFEAGSQVLANRCKLLSSKAMVVSVAVNVGSYQLAWT